ncbi:MAG: CapA family protein [Gammaproteobacteria bacterium]|nr:CapA family protein [Gammaproteobacteria bacterium]MCW8910509.1 CapA family protein [Gammaproteobacteria bacterium]
MATYSAKSIIFILTLLLSACATSTRLDTIQADSNISPQNTSPTTTATHAKQPKITRISAVGDIMLGGTAEPVLTEYGYDYPFEKVSPLFLNSDIVIGNLEGPLTTHETPYSTDKTYLFKTPPDKVAPALKKAGFTIMNLANNHILDYGVKGMEDTIQALEASKLQYLGIGNNLQQARNSLIVESQGYKIGFLSYSLTFPKSFWATDKTPGTAFGHEHEIRTDVRLLKQIADLVVVSFHWGREKTTELREYQPMLAHAAIDEGASFIIGHHPHILQAIETYKHGIILYSLGNFTFGSYSKNSAVSIVATLTLKNGNINKLELHPINVLNVDVNFQPQRLTGEEANAVIQHINQLSANRNTQLVNHNDTGLLSIQESVAIKH